MITSARISGRERALALFAVVSALLVIPALISSPSNCENAIDDAAENNKQRQPSVPAMSYFVGETKHFSTVFAEETHESKEFDILYSRTQHHMVSILARKMLSKNWIRIKLGISRKRFVLGSRKLSRLQSTGKF